MIAPRVSRVAGAAPVPATARVARRVFELLKADIRGEASGRGIHAFGKLFEMNDTSPQRDVTAAARSLTDS